MEQRRPELQPLSQNLSSDQQGAASGALFDSRDKPVSQNDLQLRPSPSGFPPSTHAQRIYDGSPSTYNSNAVGTSAATAANVGATKTPQEPVIGHMGRLVSDDRQVAMFAGSSTGVHFIHQAEQQLQMQHMHDETLPAPAYGLYLHDIWGTTGQNVQDGLIASMVQQLPEDTQSILEGTIDRWTPLYPVVHKPSVLEAYSMLISGRSGGENLEAIFLYQIVAILSLGTLSQAGSCTLHHFHCLCQSDIYYKMSTTLLDRVLDKPCLQSLQGLVLIQIYLQLSTRYSVASQMGGVATRIGQNLGLHRHSDRFKFDPLESELRRRVWWCQYALDT